MGIHAFALDQPGVTERRFVAGLLAVHQGDAAAAFLEMHGNAHADNARAEHDGIEFHYGHEFTCCRLRQARQYCKFDMAGRIEKKG